MAEEMSFKIDNRAVRDRYNFLSTKLRRKLKRDEKASGIAVEMSEVERALEELIEKEDAAEELLLEGKMKKMANDNARVNAEDIRKKGMENLRKTQKGKSEESGATLGKKRSSNGSDTIRYLKEKQERMVEVETKRLEMKERKMEDANRRHDELMNSLQRQQQQQMENFQMMMFQQQQEMNIQQAQQNELMIKLFFVC